MRITVTQAHLDKAFNEASDVTDTHNAVCLAIADAFGKEVTGVVNERAIFFNLKGPFFPVPKEAFRFIGLAVYGELEEGGFQVPFTFELGEGVSKKTLCKKPHKLPPLVR